MERFPVCVRGDDYGPIEIDAGLDSGSLADCDEITFTIRRLAVKTSPVLLQITMRTGPKAGRITVPAPSKVRFSLTAEETEALPATTLKADIQCKLPTGETKTIRMSQDFPVRADVT